MKYFLIALVLLAVAVWALIRFLHRIGEPVNAAASDSYYHHARKKIIVYSPMGNWFELGYHESTADPATFQVLSRDYGKDDKTVFWRGHAQRVDYATFRIDEHKIPKDDFRVYDDDHYQPELRVIEGADPKTFRPLTLPEDRYDHRWYRDDKAIYAAGKRMDVDATTFQRLNETLALDASHVYVITRNPLRLGSGSVSLSAKAANPGGPALRLNDTYAQIGHAIAHANWIRPFSLVFFQSIDSVRVLDERNLAVNGVLISDG
ncbi:MAG: DKNYY domain-containing protein, partial [Cyclobacteriaceae bacterium]|nr:DKNYY domain-containing protein [Cyclobacteriaceae bacterium]